VPDGRKSSGLPQMNADETKTMPVSIGVHVIGGSQYQTGKDTAMRMFAFLLVFVAGVEAAPPAGIRWIADRGGVVDERYAENSPASLEAAVRNGYWMIESDLRETKDGHIVAQHDPTFHRFFGDPRKVGELTIAEVRRLRANPGGTAPMTIAELADACKGRILLMLDIKEPEHSPAFYEKTERELRRTGMLASTYIIGLQQAVIYFKGKARVKANSRQLQEAIDKGEPVSDWYILFENGNVLTEDRIRFAQAHHVTVVPSVNAIDYYRDADPIRAGSADIRRFRALGVTEFQIDSVYERAFEQ
jgi:glycerophosphoryl diester phosphodiesterase